MYAVVLRIFYSLSG